MEQIGSSEDLAEEFLKIIEDSRLSEEEAKKRLQSIYRKNPPKFAELVINPHCPNRCKHCIYPEDYPRYNKSLNLEKWKQIISDLYNKLKFRHFIFGGRGINNLLLEVMGYINSEFPDAKIGLIADGPAIQKNFDELCKLKIAHLDISVDGLKGTHDLQRNFPGSFDITVKQIKKLMEDKGPVKSGNIGKLSILATLTAINESEILLMIEYFNKKIGIKNFFITPVNIFAGRPSPSIKLSYSETIGFIIKTMNSFKNLDDSYIAFNIYEDEIIDYLRRNYPELCKKLRPKEGFFEANLEYGNNEFHLFWYPVAINGCREFIINSNGSIFTGLVQAYGKIPNKYIFGNVLEIPEGRDKFFENLTTKEAFNFYLENLLNLKSLWNKT